MESLGTIVEGDLSEGPRCGGVETPSHWKVVGVGRPLPLTSLLPVNEELGGRSKGKGTVFTQGVGVDPLHHGSSTGSLSRCWTFRVA